MSDVRKKVQSTAATPGTHPWFDEREGKRSEQKEEARGERTTADGQANKVPLPWMWSSSSPR